MKSDFRHHSQSQSQTQFVQIFFNNTWNVYIGIETSTTSHIMYDVPVKFSNNKFGWCNLKPSWLMRFMFVYYCFFLLSVQFWNIESSLTSNFSISLFYCIFAYRTFDSRFQQRIICLCFCFSSVYYYSNAGNVRQFTIYENTIRICEECYSMLDVFTYYYYSVKIHFAYTTRFTFTLIGLRSAK